MLIQCGITQNDRQNEMDGSLKCYGEWKKPHTRVHTRGSHLFKILSRA